MNCQQAQHQLRTTVDFVAIAPAGALLAHLQQCRSCQALAEEQRLQALLQSLPVPPPSPGFADRALNQAWQQHAKAAKQQPREPGSATAISRWPMAAAASVLAVVGGFALLLNQLPEQNGDGQIASGTSAAPAEAVVADAAALQHVDLLLMSGSSYPRANITLHLDENLSLQGYPGRRALQWQAHIAAGSNQLTLPVVLDEGDSGEFTVEIESDGVRKRATFTVSGKDAVATNRLAVHLRQPIANEV